jgi:hypothetical protein
MAKITATRGASYPEGEEPAEAATSEPEPAEDEAAEVEAPAEDAEPVADAVELTEYDQAEPKLERPADSDLKPAWIAFAVDQGADEAWANDPSTTKAQLIEQYG